MNADETEAELRERISRAVAKHATVRISGYVCPLIGVPPAATEERCDGCGRTVHLTEITWCAGRWLCENCRI